MSYKMSDKQLTSLSALLGDENENSQDQPEQMQGRPHVDHRQMHQLPPGVSQGVSSPDGPVRKEFFGLVKDFDYKTVILIFVLIFILSSGIFSTCVRPYVPASVGSDGKTTFVGSAIAAILGVLIFIVVKITAKI